MNSLDKNLSSELLAGLAQYGIWSADRILRFIEAIENEHNLSVNLAATIPYLPENILEKTVKLLDRLSKPSEKAKVLVRLSARKVQAFQRAYEEVQNIKDNFEKAMLLIELCRQNKSILQEAIRTARDIPNKYHQAIAIIELIIKVIPEDQNLVQDVLKIAENMTQGDYSLLSEQEKELDNNDRAFIYSQIMHYADDRLQYVLEVARNNSNKDNKANILSNLAKYYDKIQFLDEATDAIREVSGSRDQSELMSFLRECGEEYIKDSFTLARKINDKYEQFCFLSSLYRGQEHLYANLSELVYRIEDPYRRGLSLLTFEQPLADIKTTEIREQIKDDQLKAYFMLEVASRLHDPLLQYKIVEEVLDIAEFSQYDHRKSFILCRLISYDFSELHLPRIKKLIYTIEDPIEKAWSLAEYLKYDKSLYDEVYELLNIQSYNFQSRLIFDIGYITLKGNDQLMYEKFRIIVSLADIYEQALVDGKRLVDEMQNSSYKALALCGLAVHIPDLCSLAFKSTQDIVALFARADALASLTIHCSDELFLEIMNDINSLQPSEYKAQAYSKIFKNWYLEDCSYQDYSEWLHILSNRKRSDLLQDLIHLQPAIINLGGEDIINALIISMQEVCNQWP
jgi:hypothetical protein